ncbi:MAG: type II secretion system F family protein [Phycisphaerales bacterium]|nr:MAG: type II secretion system F family protein [Phycisphaerales bacterium]
MNTQDMLNVIFGVAVFGLVLSAWCICVMLWVIQYAKRRKEVRIRLGLGSVRAERSQVLQLWRDEYQARRQPTVAKKPTLGDRLEQLRAAAAWKAPVQVVLLALAGVTGLAFTVTYVLTGVVLFGLIASGAVVAVFWTYTKRRISARVVLFERQFVDSLGIAARALRAGHPLAGSFQLVSEEIDEPMQTVFAQICQEQALGLDLQDSIRRVADSNRNADLRLFATAVTIQLSSGGNLAELMDSLASIMRARMRLNRRVRILTAQTQMSKKLLIAIPIILFVLLNILAPEYMIQFYTTWSGRCMLAITAGSVLFGAWLMSKISVLKY